MVWGCFLWSGLGNIVPMKLNLYVSAYNDVLESLLPPTLRQCFIEGTLLFEHNNTPVLGKEDVGLHKSLTPLSIISA